MYLQVDNSTITKAVYIASGITLFLVILIILFVILYRKSHNVYLKEKELMNAQFDHALLQSQIEVQEATYSVLGKELHDNVGQLLSSAKMLIGISERTIPNVPETLITANETIGKAINELRSLSKSLNREWLEQFNLIENLHVEVERINTSKTVKLHLTLTNETRLQADEQIILFRIIQEAIQNAIKHSGASNIYIRITVKNNLLQILVTDDGSGFKEHEVLKGVGILNMKHRVKLLKGNIEWLNNNEGTTVIISLPIKPDEL